MIRVSLLLAGGRSRRFGREKALEPLEGRPLADHVLDRLRPGAADVALAGPPALGDRLGLPALADDAGLPRGPLAGVAAGLRWGRERGAEWVLTAPCDAPRLPLRFGAQLAEAIGERPVLAARARRRHPLCALWRTGALEEVLERGSHDRQPPLSSLVEGLGGGYLEFPDEDAFANINTPMDLEALRACAPGSSRPRP